MDYCRWILVINLHLLLSCRGLKGQGLFLSLRGTPIDNDGFVNAGDISLYNDSLLCLTNATDCCGGDNRTGDWFFPNGTIVDSFSDNGGSPNNDFFSRNRGQSVVRLNRYNNPSERGRFHCELLGSTIYVNILDIGPVSISPSTPTTVTVGQSVYLQCSVDITPHPLPAGTSTPEFEWLFGQTFNQPLTSITTNSGSTYTSTLQLTSVSESDGGMYTCRLRGNHRTAVNTTVSVEPVPTTGPSTTSPPPMVSVSITASGTNTAGETYSLVCSVTVTGSTDTPTITWFDSMDSTVPSDMVSTTGSMSTLAFNPLSTSHAGTYTCRATVDGGMQTNANQGAVDVTVQVPYPTLSITSNPTGVIPPIGSVTLTCTVVLDSSVDVAVAVNTVWTGPAGVALSPTDPVAVSLRRYTSTVMVSSFGRDQSGDYTCKATVSSASQSPFIINSLASSATIRVTAAAVSTVQIDDGGLTPVTGQSYTLTCNVSGTSFTTYQWRKDGAVISGETGPTLTFSPLRLPDAGQYSCDNGTLFSNNRSITLQVPGPATVSITSNVASPVILGTAVTLSCTVELSPALRESDLTLLTVDVQLFRDGIPLTLTSTLTVTGTTFIYSTRFNSFDRTDSGNYTCVATVRPQPTASTYILISESGSSLQSPAYVIVAGISPPLNVRASQASPFDPVEVSWSPPSSGATAITRYTIFYDNGANVSLPSVATSIGLTLNGDHVGEIVSVCAEAAQLASQCVNTSVGAKNGEMTTDNIISDSMKCSHTTEIGTTAAVIFAVMATIILCLVVALVVVIVWLLWIKRKKIATKGDFAVSANVAYGEVKLEDSGAVYEDLDKVVKRVEGNYELTEHPTAYEFPVIQPAAPVCDTAGGSTKPSCEQQQQQQQAAKKDSAVM